LLLLLLLLLRQWRRVEALNFRLVVAQLRLHHERGRLAWARIGGTGIARVVRAVDGAAQRLRVVEELKLI
jgi:hypothetical protein